MSSFFGVPCIVRAVLAPPVRPSRTYWSSMIREARGALRRPRSPDLRMITHDDSPRAATVPLFRPLARLTRTRSSRRTLPCFGATLGPRRPAGGGVRDISRAGRKSCAGPAAPDGSVSRTGPGHVCRHGPISATRRRRVAQRVLHRVLHPDQRRRNRLIGVRRRARTTWPRRSADGCAGHCAGLHEGRQGADDVTRRLLTIDVDRSHRRIPPSPPPHDHSISRRGWRRVS